MKTNILYRMKPQWMCMCKIKLRRVSLFLSYIIIQLITGFCFYKGKRNQSRRKNLSLLRMFLFDLFTLFIWFGAFTLFASRGTEKPPALVGYKIFSHREKIWLGFFFFSFPFLVRRRNYYIHPCCLDIEQVSREAGSL